MRKAVRLVSIGALIAVTTQLGIQQAAMAQASVADKAAAQVLFDEGRRLSQEGNYVEACKRFEQSQAIEPGIGNLLYLADCYEHLDRTASAWALYADAASRAAAAGETERASAGRRRADALKARLSTLTVEVPQPHALPGLEIVREGQLVAASLWGVAVPIDPGDYNIIARAPGHIPWSSSLHVGAKAARASLTIPLLPEEPLRPAPASRIATDSEHAARLPPPLQLTAATSTTSPVATGGSPLPVLGISLAGLGGAALIAGAIFGGRAIAKNNQAKAFCPGGGSICNDMRGLELTDQADTAATLANVLVIGGGALLLSGTIVYLTAPSSSERSGVALAVGSSALKLTLTEAF